MFLLSSISYIISDWIFYITVWGHARVNSYWCVGCHGSARGALVGVAGACCAWRDSCTMLTFMFAVWSAARALGWACEAASTSPEMEEVPVLPRLRSARASSDLSTLSTTTTSSSQTSSSEPNKRSTSLSLANYKYLMTHNSYCNMYLN